MKNVLKRGIALTIVMALSISNVNMQSFVVKAEQSTVVEESLDKKNATVDKGICEPEVVEEVLDERTNDSTTFLLSNGMKQTTYYSDNIYFKDEKGNLSEYDSELVKLDKRDKKEVLNSVEVDKDEKDEYKYVNNEGDTKQFLPNKLSSETPVVMTKDDYVISFSPDTIEENGSSEELSDNILSDETKKIAITSENVENIYSDSEEEKNVIATYNCKDENTNLSYESLEHGLKETITLQTKPESNVFSFELTLQDTYAKVDEVGGGITIYSEDDDIVGGIAAPFMNDATEENYSEDLHYELQLMNAEEGVKKYVLRLVVNSYY